MAEEQGDGTGITDEAAEVGTGIGSALRYGQDVRRVSVCVRE